MTLNVETLKLVGMENKGKCLDVEAREGREERLSEWQVLVTLA